MEQNLAIQYQQRLCQKISEYFKLFVEEILGLDNAPFHNEIDDILSDPLYKKICIAIARDHGKSTHLSIAYPLWAIAKNHNIRILQISSTAAIAVSFLREILNHIEGNEKYRVWSEEIDPDHVGVIPRLAKKYSKRKEKWSGNAITIDRTNLNIKDPTINALGLFGSILSKRADVIILDDVVNQQNSETEDQRKKVIDWFYTTIMPVLTPGGRIIYLGNTWRADDLVEHLMKDPQIEFKKRLGAIRHEPDHMELWQEWAGLRLDEGMSLKDRIDKSKAYYDTHRADMDAGVQVLWPERHPYADLYLKRLSNSYAFARMYQCDISDRPDQRFKEEWLDRAKDLGKDMRLQDQPREGLIMDITTSGLDLAISEEESSDDTAYIALDRVRVGNGIIKPGFYILRNIHRGKMSPNSVRQLVQEKNATIQPLEVRVESVGYQEAMVRDLSDMGVDNVVGYHTGGEKNDPDIGVNSLAILAELGKLVIPYDVKDPRTIQLCSQLVDEMRSYPSGHTGDSLMAFWFAFSAIRDLTSDMYLAPRKEPDKVTKVMTAEEQKKEEKKVDIAQALEDEYQRRLFRGY